MRIFLSAVLISFIAVNLQAQLNDYKYIIVPKRFDDFKNANEHKTSTLVKHLFSKKGFLTVYDDAIPEELYANRCTGLRVHLDDQSSMFTTKTTLVLKDCNDSAVFLSQEGRSRKKEYQLAYQEAITDAFRSIQALNYSYSGKSEKETVTLDFKNDVKSLKEDMPAAEKQTQVNKINPAVQQEATRENQRYENIEPVPSAYKKGSPEESSSVQQVATQEEQSYSDKTPIASNITKTNAPSSIEKLSGALVLYAQELPNGYQLVDSSPKIVMTLFRTSMKDIYAAKKDDTSGLVFKRGDKWFFDYTQDEKLIQQELHIKF